MRLWIGLLCASALSACSPAQNVEEKAAPAAASAAADSNVLSAQGWGPLRIGMSRDDVASAVGASAPGGVDADPEACTEFHPARAPEGVWVMLEDGVLTRITLLAPATIQTAHGLGVGASAEAVNRLMARRCNRKNTDIKTRRRAI
jgi:hypothetical protein